MFKRYTVIQSFTFGMLMLASSLAMLGAYVQAPNTIPAQQRPNNMPPAQQKPDNMPQQGPDLSNLLERMPTDANEIAAWQAEVDAEINKYVSTLPPEQQQQFYKDVDELTNVMNNMSDEELNGFLSTVMAPEQQPKQQPTTPATPKPTPIKPQEEAKRVVIPAKYSVEHMRKTILSIADSIESFLLKIKTMALPGERILKNWLALNMKSKTSWDVMHADLETANQRLRTIAQERIPGTQKYRYLPFVIENENLCNNLERINDVLKKTESAIEPPAFGLGELENSSQEAIEKTARILTEALYMVHITAILESIIKQFEPEAKKLHEAEEAAKKQASEAAKRKPKGTPLVQTPESAPYYGGGYSPSTGGSYGGYQPAPYTPPAQRAKEKEEETKKASEAEDKKKGAGKKEAPKKEESAADKEKAKEDKRGDDFAESLQKGLEDFKEIVDEYASLKNLVAHAADPVSKVDAELVNQAFPRLNTALDHINEALRGLRAHIKRMKDNKRGNVELFVKEIASFKTKYLNDLIGLNGQIETVIANPPVSPAKRKKYLGLSEPEPTPAKVAKPEAGAQQLPEKKKVVKEETEEAPGELQKIGQKLTRIIDTFNKPLA